MAENGTYTLLPEDDQQTAPAFSPNQMAEIYRMLHDFDEPKRKKKKKGKGKGKKKGKAKKWEKAIANLIESNEKTKKKSKGKKSKGKKSKGKKKAKRELRNQLLVMTTEKSLDTASYGARRYFDYRWPVYERDAKAE